MLVIESAMTQFGPIEKLLRTSRAANLRDYDTMCRHFSWDRLRSELSDRADEKMNMAMLAIDRHAKLTPNKLALPLRRR